MNFQKRKSAILALLQSRDTLEVQEIADTLGVSGITIRRDLNAFASEGLIVRTRGGAMSLSAARHPVSFAGKAAGRREEKEYIAGIAAMHVADGDILFVDCGSTASCLAPHLLGRDVKVITNSLPVMSSLAGSGVQVNVIGGEFDHERQAVHGPTAVQHIMRYRATKAFIGADGVSLRRGLSAASEKEAEITLAMASQSEEVFLLCDSSKLESDRYMQFAPLSLVHVLISDASAGREVMRAYEKAGLRVFF